MKGKQLAILTLVAVILVALAFASKRRQAGRNPVSAGRKILPELAVNDVQSILIQAPDGTATVARTEGLWRVAERFQYPADFDKIRNLLNKLAELKSLQTVRATPRQRTELRLAPDAAAGADGQPTVLTLRNASGQTMETLWLGKERMPQQAMEADPYGGYPDGRFVATSKGDVFLAGDPLDEVLSSPRAWMDEEFVTIPAEEVLAIEVSGVTNGAIRLSRTDGAKPFALPSVPEGKEADADKLSRLASALAYLRFEDVAQPNTSPAAAGLDKPVIFTATTSKGVTCTLRIGRPTAPEGRYHAAVAMSFTPPPAPAATAEAASTNAVAKAREEQNAKTAAHVARLSEKLSPWTYVLGKYEAETLVMGYSDLLKDKSAPETGKPESANP